MSKSAPHTMKAQTGFSLLELAVVLAIIGILLGGILMAVSATTESARRAETRAQLNNVMQALYGFAQANGRLPCPATTSSDGLEARSELPADLGRCIQYRGFVPIHTLGLAGSVNEEQLLQDAWGNSLRYSVSTFRSATTPPVDDDFAFTRAPGLSFLFNNTTLPDLTPAERNQFFRICNNSNCDQIITDTVPAVVFSMGSNWSTFTSAEEQMNASLNPNDTDFVAAEYSEENFDDIIVWMSPYVLFTRMITAGRLP